MALGVLNNLSAIYAENNLNNTNNSLQTVLQQLSSGSRINSGADDAAGLSLVNGLAANSAALTQSETNATEGVGLLQVADGALSQVTSLLNRAVTLATEASNGTLNSTQESAANQEYQSILAEVSNIGSTTTYNQQQVFTGTDVAIYTGDSSTAGASIDNLNIRSLSTSSVGDSDGTMTYSNGASNVFINLSTGSTNAAVTDSLNSSGHTAIEVSYLTKGANGTATIASATITVGSGTSYANTAQGLINAINNSGLGLSATFSTAQNAGTAAVASALGAGTETGILISGESVGAGANTGVVGELTANGAGDTLSGTVTIGSSQITLGTPDSTDNLTDLQSYINQGNYGVTASLTGSTLTLTSSNSTLSVSGTSLQDLTGGTLTLSNVPTPLANMTTSAGAIATLTAEAPADTFGGAGGMTLQFTGANGQTASVAIAANSSLATVEQEINNETATTGVSASLDAATGVLTLSSTSPDSQASITNAQLSALAATDSGGGAGATVGNILTPPVAYYSTGISSAAGITDTSDGGGGTTETALTTDTDGTSGIATISYSDGVGEDLSGTDLSNQTDAQSALNKLNVAIGDVAALDGYIGAQINTLNSISQVMSTQQENVVSAQNAIQATDYASATSNMSKYEILSQTGIAALAQANSVQQEVTKLLQ